MKPCLLFLYISLFFSSCSSIHKANKEENSKPNIVFILVDDMGWGDLGSFYQNQRAEENDRSEPWQWTPELDKMAKEGIRLTDHYSNAPVCAPSRASFLLGVHQGHSNVRDNQFDKRLEDNYTVANTLQEAGYETVVVGKWGLQGDNQWSEDGDGWPGHPLNRGFDEFYGYMRHRDGHEHYPVEGIYRGKKEVWHNRENVAAQLVKCYTGDLWTAFAKKWIADHQEDKKDQPFFMFLAYDTPHAVLELPTQAYPEGGGIQGGLQWTGEPGHMINTASGEVDSWTHPDYAKATWDHDQDPSTAEVPWPETYQRYATVNRRIDRAVGDIRALLEDLQIAENTLVVFTSDNGPSRESYLPEGYVSNEPDFFRSYGPFDGIKRDLWEGGIRVPAIVTWPGTIPQDRVSNTAVMMSDWPATFIEMAGMPVPERMDGAALGSLLLEGTPPEDHAVYVEYAQGGQTPNYADFLPAHRGRKRGQMQMIRLEDMVGVRYNIQSHQDDFEIYNVADDPQESHNLADQPGFAKLQGEMKDRVLQMRVPNSTAQRPYDSELVPAIPDESGERSNGLQVDWYEVNTRWIPKIVDLNPVHSAVLSDFTAAGDTPGNMILFSGFIQAPESGSYSFQVESPDQVIVRIHDALVIDGDYRAGESIRKEGSIWLEEGWHPVRVYLKNDQDGIRDFEVKWKNPMITSKFETIPSNVLSH